MVCMEQYCIYCKTVQKIYYFAVNASFAVSFTIFALKFNFLKLHKVAVKLVQSCYKFGDEKLQKMVQKHRKTYQLVAKNLEKTWKKLGKKLEQLKDFE